MADSQKIAQEIERIVRDTFGDDIDSVRVRLAQDPDGEAIFDIIVVLSQLITALDAQKTSGITRHVRHKLLELKDDSFPIFAFMSKADAQKRMKAEAG